MVDMSGSEAGEESGSKSEKKKKKKKKKKNKKCNENSGEAARGVERGEDQCVGGLEVASELEGGDVALHRIGVVAALSDTESISYHWDVGSEGGGSETSGPLLLLGTGKDLLPEWSDLEGKVVLDIAYAYLPEGERLTALSCDDGTLVLSRTRIGLDPTI